MHIMNQDELLELARDHETQTLELKENLMKPAALADIMMQLANADGGLIILGLTNSRPPQHSGRIGAVTQDELDQIRSAAHECLRPPLELSKVEVVKITDPASYAVVITIPDSPDLHQHISGTLARRLGGRREAIYLDQEGNALPGALSSFEDRAIPGTTLDDIDLAQVTAFVRALTERRPETRIGDVEDLELLRGLGAVTGEPGSEQLTGLGGLFFARAPEQLLPQSRITVIEFPGTEVAVPGQAVAYTDARDLTGTIPELIPQVEELLGRRISRAAALSGFKMEGMPSVPNFALREAVVNAVCHRDYGLVGGNTQVRLFADRIEIQSPGGLPWPVTVDNIVTESYARNPKVANALKELGYVERYGIGIDNMIRSMQEAHLPTPEFQDSAGSFTVTLRLHGLVSEEALRWVHGVGAERLPEEHQKALITAWRNGRLVNSDYQSLAFVDGPEATKQLHSMVEAGWLIQNGTRGAAYYTLGPAALGTGADVKRAQDLFPGAALDQLSASQARILDIVISLGSPQASDVLAATGGSDRRNVQRVLASLVERDFLIRRAKSKSDPNAFYEVNRDFNTATGQQSLFD